MWRPRASRGSEAAAELWRVVAKWDSPGGGAALVRNPLEFIVRVRVRAPRFVRGWLRGWSGGGLLLFMVYRAPVAHEVHGLCTLSA